MVERARRDFADEAVAKDRNLFAVILGCQMIHQTSSRPFRGPRRRHASSSLRRARSCSVDRYPLNALTRGVHRGRRDE
jgi:hypothetical protein